MITLRIRQDTLLNGHYPIRLTLKRPDKPDMEAEANIEFGLNETERAELQWYLEVYLSRSNSVTDKLAAQIEDWMKRRGEELYTKVLAANGNTQSVWFAVREHLEDLRVEITTGIAEAGSIPWELMRDPQLDSAIALRVQSFVRVQSNPNIGFVPMPPVDNGRLRLLYIACRLENDKVELRATANRLLQDLGGDLVRFDITVLRPPTFEQLQQELTDAKADGRPYHMVHFDGHGSYADLSNTIWAAHHNHALDSKHGYLWFEHPEHKERPVSGDELGKLLHDTGVPVLVLNACQSAMHEIGAGEEPAKDNVHDEVRAIGSLSQAVVDQGIPAVLGMRYSVFVVTAAQYIGQLYANLAKGRSFGQAASEGRKHLYSHPDRWVGLQPRPLQDWCVPVVYEAAPLQLLLPKAKGLSGLQLDQRPELDPVQTNEVLRRFVPDTGFVGRDETLLLLDRAFDKHSIVLLHAYAGQGKTATAVEFARWYARTGGLGPQPVVLFTSFETHTDLTNVLNQIGQFFAPVLQANDIEWHALNDNTTRRNLILQVLHQIPVLWIWDNVEPVAGFPVGTPSTWTQPEQDELADFLKQVKLDGATKVKLLLTSRRDEQAWLQGIPYRIKMPRMTHSDAANLARSLGNEKKISRQEIAHWQPLLDYCHGNPLMLRVLVSQAVKMGLRDKISIENFVEAIRTGEQAIQDTDEAQGRDKSLGASLDYGFRNAFQDDELPVIALLHLFQGTVEVDVLDWMGKVRDHALPELQGKTKEEITSVLDRARDIGLLTHLGETWYIIHPALPWFLRQYFDKHYDGQAGRSTAIAALRAWVEAIKVLGDYYYFHYAHGNKDVIQCLIVLEANLLYARRIARHNGWWAPLIGAMQGLRVLYDHQGHQPKWSQLVAEIASDYCTTDDAPVPGREDQYTFIMHYRVRLAQNYDHDLYLATALQEKMVDWNRQQATSALALPDGASLDPDQRNHIRTLAVALESQGHILRGQDNPDCVAAYDETIFLSQRIQDNDEESRALFGLGNSYLFMPAIRDLDAAEEAFQRSMALCSSSDELSCSRCLQAIGIIHHSRFKESIRKDIQTETVLKHAQAAEQYFQQALALCPVSALSTLHEFHNALGALYSDLLQSELAIEQYEIAVQIAEQTGDRYGAGSTRFNMALMYDQAAGRESDASRQHDLLHRAQAYAEAAMRDFQHYQGRAADDEANTQRLLDYIAQDLDNLSVSQE